MVSLSERAATRTTGRPSGDSPASGRAAACFLYRRWPCQSALRYAVPGLRVGSGLGTEQESVIMMVSTPGSMPPSSPRKGDAALEGPDSQRAPAYEAIRPCARLGRNEVRTDDSDVLTARVSRARPSRGGGWHHWQARDRRLRVGAPRMDARPQSALGLGSQTPPPARDEWPLKGFTKSIAPIRQIEPS